jgi:hypothetical protein
MNYLFCRCKHGLIACTCAYCTGDITKPSEYGPPSRIDYDLSDYYKLQPNIQVFALEEMGEL